MKKFIKNSTGFAAGVAMGIAYVVVNDAKIIYDGVKAIVTLPILLKREKELYKELENKILKKQGIEIKEYEVYENK